jgi:hypothetical protein
LPDPTGTFTVNAPGEANCATPSTRGGVEDGLEWSASKTVTRTLPVLYSENCTVPEIAT